jgi:hypothetical protein
MTAALKKFAEVGGALLAATSKQNTELLLERDDHTVDTIRRIENRGKPLAKLVPGKADGGPFMVQH